MRDSNIRKNKENKSVNANFTDLINLLIDIRY